MKPQFEGSYQGDNQRLRDEAVLECPICWYQYDSAQGDEVWQIPAGTPFSQLPDYWSCPQCDGSRHRFILVSP